MQKPAAAVVVAAAIVSIAAVALSGSSDGGAVAAPAAPDPTAASAAPTPTSVQALKLRGRHEAMELGLRPSPGAPSPAARRNATAARVALEQLGTPYSYGGASPAGFDCSGLVRFAFDRVGTALPHSSYALWDAGRRVPRRDLRAGDLVFFNGLGHVGISIGGGRFVHAPQTGGVVEVVRLAERDDYLGAVRV